MIDFSFLQSISKVRQFSKNEMVFMQHEAGDTMYIVTDGLFGVYINSFSDFPVRVAGIGQGLFIGEMSVIDGSPRSATVISETESAALIIDKENFSSLLENAPEIAGNIMDTMRNRVITTAEAVRKAGKEAPELPPLLKVIKFRDVKSSMSFLVMLARKVREMNELLAVQSSVPASPTVEKLEKDKLIKLLPDDYNLPDRSDLNDNDNLLSSGKGICPYCRLESPIRFPNFSRLVQKELRLDQRLIFEDFDVLWYTNIVCPNCCYTDSYQEFMKGGSAGKPEFSESQFKNEEGFTGFSSPVRHRLGEVVKSYYLRIACVESLTDDPLRMAKIWIRLYWVYSDVSAKPLAVKAAAKAYAYYVKYANECKGALGIEDKMRLNAVIGELLAMMGEREKAMGYFLENSRIGRLLNNEVVKQSIQRYRELKNG